MKNNILSLFMSLALLCMFSQTSFAQPEKEVNPPKAPSMMVPTVAGGAVDLSLMQTTLTGNGTPAQDFEAAFNIYDTEAADDFIIPAGGARSIISVEAVFTNPNGTAVMNVYADAANSPGALVFSESFPGIVASPIMLISTTCPPLDPGKYWLSLQMDQAFLVTGQAFWTTATEELGGTPWMVQNPGNGFASGCTTWADGAGCGFAGGSGPGLNYVINLSAVVASAPVPTMGEWALIVLAMLLLIIGTVAVTQRQSNIIKS